MPPALIADSGEDIAMDTADLATRLDRLLRERDAVGPVNLLAEREMAEIETRLAEFDPRTRRLTAAMHDATRHRSVDQEGAPATRRVRAAQQPFRRPIRPAVRRRRAILPGSATATRCRTGSTSSPPAGKRLQKACRCVPRRASVDAICFDLCRVFANPAADLVLDEVDAPLDDANVDGFCRLVADDSRHHRHPLPADHPPPRHDGAVDRLFGVTMAERGVSQAGIGRSGARRRVAPERLNARIRTAASRPYLLSI